MDQITKWLSGAKNFIIGRAIYRAMISDQDELIQSLDAGFTPHRHTQLIKAMELHINPPKKEITAEDRMRYGWGDDDEFQKNNVSLPHTPSIKLVSLVESKKIIVDPYVLTALKNEWQIPYKKMQYLIGQLDQFGNSNKKSAITKRAELAKEILELEQLCNQIWAKRDQYELTGVLENKSADELEIPSDPIALAELIIRIKKSIRNNRLLMQKNPDNPIYIERFKNYKMQYFKATGKHYNDQQQLKK
jgi:hypothetical protein